MRNNSEDRNMAEDCSVRRDKMDSWEEEFIISILSLVEDNRTLTPKQGEALDNVWEKVTADG